MISRIRLLSALALVAGLLTTADGAHAQSPPGQPGGQSAPEPTLSPSPTLEPGAEAPDSPRASARKFVELATIDGDFAGAARYLTLSPDEKSRGPQLARRIRAVLERTIDVDLDALSPHPEGATDDGLPRGVDKLGEIPDGRGGQDPVFLVRSRDERGQLLGLLPADRLPHRRLVRRAARPLDPRPDPGAAAAVRAGASCMWWQWLAVPVLALLALALGRILGASHPRRALPRDPAHRDPLGRAASREDRARAHAALGGRGGDRASVLAGPAAPGRARRPRPARRHRHRRRLLGSVALRRRVGAASSRRGRQSSTTRRPGRSSPCCATSARPSWRWAASSPPSPPSATPSPPSSRASASAAWPSRSAPRRRSRTCSARSPSRSISPSGWATS